MGPLMTELGAAAIITAIGTAVGSVLAALWQGMKTRAEVSTMQVHMSAAMASTQEALATAQHELTHDHGSSMKDSSVRSEGKLDQLILSQQALDEKFRGMAAEQARQGDTVHSLDRGLGGVRDDLRIIRAESGQTRSEVAEVRTSVAELDSSADRTHQTLAAGQRQLEAGQKGLAERLDQLTGPACTGWDHGDHVTNHHTQEES